MLGHFRWLNLADRNQNQTGGGATHHGGFGEDPPFNLIIKATAIKRGAFAKIAGIGCHVRRHHQNVIGNALAIVLNIGLRDLVRAIKNGAHPIGKPKLHAILKQQRRKYHHQYGGHGRDAGKQGHQSQVQPRDRQAASTVGDQDGHAPADQHDQQHRWHQIGHQKQRHQRLRSAIGRQALAGEPGIAGPAHDDGEPSSQKFKLQIIAADPSQHTPPKPSPAYRHTVGQTPAPA